MDALRDGQSAVVEIYTRIYIRNAGLSGKKIRTTAELNVALAALGSPPVQAAQDPDRSPDRCAGHRRGNARPSGQSASAFDPPGLTPEIARTEGWTFGIV